MSLPDGQMSALTGLGGRIRRTRALRGLSQRELAARAGLTHKLDVSRWERGVAIPRLEAVVAVARALGVTVSELIGY
jgi:transcriptional regulator with XRE-family HTH domain